MPRGSPLQLRHGPLTVYLKPLDGCPPLEPLIQAVVSDEAPVVWLDSARRHPVTGRWSIVGFDPWLTLCADAHGVEVRTSAATHLWRINPLEALQQVLTTYHVPPCAQAHARGLGLVGVLSYDLNRWIERLSEPQPAPQPFPDMVWWAMRVVLVVDHLEERTWLMSVVDPHRPAPVARREALDALAWTADRLKPGTPCDVGVGRETSRVSLEATCSRAEFESMVSRALEFIRCGEIFQANLSQRFSAPWTGEAFDLYQRLRSLNPSPFACFLSWGTTQVVSCSPERLVRVQEGQVETRPIAGTRPRGATAEGDAINSLELLVSEKERAEHVMLVDLARNDLGRVCRSGSVGVRELMTLEAYSHVIHIVSDVTGILQDGLGPVDVLRAVFPGGTITGCPKVRCMQILRQLEPVRRGLYTGSVGYLGFDGTLDLNIAIRTMLLQEERVSFHVGAGIVADSDPGREYDETLAKAGALVAALQAVVGPAIAPRPSAVGGTLVQKRLGGRDVAPRGAGVRVPRALPVGLHSPTAIHGDSG